MICKPRERVDEGQKGEYLKSESSKTRIKVDTFSDSSSLRLLPVFRFENLFRLWLRFQLIVVVRLERRISKNLNESGLYYKTDAILHRSEPFSLPALFLSLFLSFQETLFHEHKKIKSDF